MTSSTESVSSFSLPFQIVWSSSAAWLRYLVRVSASARTRLSAFSELTWVDSFCRAVNRLPSWALMTPKPSLVPVWPTSSRMRLSWVRPSSHSLLCSSLQFSSRYRMSR